MAVVGEAGESWEEKARLALKKAELDGDKVRKEGAAVAADVKELLAKQPWLLEKEGELGAKVSAAAPHHLTTPLTLSSSSITTAPPPP